MVKIVCLSDTHEAHRKVTVPEGDLLLYAGDITYNGSIPMVEDFNVWLGGLPHRKKIVIAGNHDFNFERKPETRELITNAEYLEDSGTEFEGLKIWGSPISPWFGGWAFNRARGSEIDEHWKLIPNDTDVLITHGPPLGVLDRPFGKKAPVGCEMLAHRVAEIKPKLHLFGHVHGGYGTEKDIERDIFFVNASIMDELYRPVNAPIVAELASR